MSNKWDSNFDCLLEVPWWSILNIKIEKIIFDQNGGHATFCDDMLFHLSPAGLLKPNILVPGAEV